MSDLNFIKPVRKERINNYRFQILNHKCKVFRLSLILSVLCLLLFGIACSSSDGGNTDIGSGSGESASSDTNAGTDADTEENSGTDDSGDTGSDFGPGTDDSSDSNDSSDTDSGTGSGNDSDSGGSTGQDDDNNNSGSSTPETPEAPVVPGIPCLPEGLYSTPGTTPDYCDVYDEDGREKMGADHPRRIIGYFTEWRTGENGQARYLVSDIPWEKITHINYAFAHIDSNDRISVGDTSDTKNPATGLEWTGVAGAEMSSAYTYKGHFNLLNKYKQQYPHVKTLISVGGWAETGGHFDSSGNRIADGGFYSMTTNNNGSTNTAGINVFADSVVTFLREYGFDGVDIDYEYPSSMSGSGNPLDFGISDNMRGSLMQSYVVLMKTLREKLDAAGKTDGTHYMLTIAAPASGYLLRGMETFQVTQYLDYINIMSYDMHGAWNEFVGHNAPLFDTGNDSEMSYWDVYTTSQYGGIGYLNTDWAYHYFRGAVAPGRINIGIPYYTRGWQEVNGGDKGLNGTAPLSNQSACPSGTGGSAKCGYGATGINNLWHDLDENGNEMGAGSNPLWHAKNLQSGIEGSYQVDYGLDPAVNPIVGNYNYYHDSTAVASWLWNDSQRVFLSYEDEVSLEKKLNYVSERGIGGVMFWELAGDFGWDTGRGEYYIGNTMTNLTYNTFQNASSYGIRKSNQSMPAETVNIVAEMSGFKVGDQNYPITPKLKITNNSGVSLSGGTEIQFDMPTSTSGQISDQSGVGLTVIRNGDNTGGNNIGGLDNDYHRLSFKIPTWQTLSRGQSLEFTINYYLPVTGPSNFTVAIGNKTYAFTSEYPQLPVADLASIDSGNGNGGAVSDCDGIDLSGVTTYPVWPAGDHASGGDRVTYNGQVWEAKWWANTVPGSDSSWELVCADTQVKE